MYFATQGIGQVTEPCLAKTGPEMFINRKAGR